MDIQSFWQAVLTQNAQALVSYFHADAVIRWHCSNEQFSVQEFIRANCEYPGDWTGEIERMHQADDTFITAVHVCSQDGTLHFHVTSFMKIRDGKIESLDEYWGDDGPPPAWRREMRLGKPIREETV